MKKKSLKRVLVFLGVITVILSCTFFISFILSSIPSLMDDSTIEGGFQYNISNISTQLIQSRGEIRPDSIAIERKTVVIDDMHGNRFQNEDIQPLISGITEGGNEVKFLDREDNYRRLLTQSDAFIIIEPSEEYTESEIIDVERFVDNGGHLLLIGEPNKKNIVNTLDQTSVNTERSSLTTIGSSFGFSFGTNYLYNLEEKDGNYRNIIVNPTNHSIMNDVEKVTMYTATDVTSQTGTHILISANKTRKSDIHEIRKYPVATINEGVLAVGDKDIFSTNKYTIADNEKFIEAVIEFLISGKASVNYSYK